MANFNSQQNFLNNANVNVGSGGSGSGILLGDWDPSTNTPTLPAIPTSPAYAVSEYYISIGTGTFNGEDYEPGDTIRVVPNGAALAWNKGSSAGAITSISIETANGFSGNVLTVDGAAAITLGTNLFGMLKGAAGGLAQATPDVDYAYGALANILVTGQDTITFDTPADILNLVGVGVNITTDDNTNTMTFTVTGGGGSPGGITGNIQYNTGTGFGGFGNYDSPTQTFSLRNIIANNIAEAISFPTAGTISAGPYIAVNMGGNIDVTGGRSISLFDGGAIVQENSGFAGTYQIDSIGNWLFTHSGGANMQFSGAEEYDFDALISTTDLSVETITVRGISTPDALIKTIPSGFLNFSTLPVRLEQGVHLPTMAGAYFYNTANTQNTSFFRFDDDLTVQSSNVGTRMVWEGIQLVAEVPSGNAAITIDQTGAIRFKNNGFESIISEDTTGNLTFIDRTAFVQLEISATGTNILGDLNIFNIAKDSAFVVSNLGPTGNSRASFTNAESYYFDAELSAPDVLVTNVISATALGTDIDGRIISVSGSSGTPGGASGAIQWNDAGDFGGAGDYDVGTDTFSMTNLAASNIDEAISIPVAGTITGGPSFGIDSTGNAVITNGCSLNFTFSGFTTGISANSSGQLGLYDSNANIRAQVYAGGIDLFGAINYRNGSTIRSYNASNNSFCQLANGGPSGSSIGNFTGATSWNFATLVNANAGLVATDLTVNGTIIDTDGILTIANEFGINLSDSTHTFSITPDLIGGIVFNGSSGSYYQFLKEVFLQNTTIETGSLNFDSTGGNVSSINTLGSGELCLNDYNGSSRLQVVAGGNYFFGANNLRNGSTLRISNFDNSSYGSIGNGGSTGVSNINLSATSWNFTGVVNANTGLVATDLTTTNVISAVAAGTDSAGKIIKINFAIGEVPSGLVNGINTSFTLAHAPSSSLAALYLAGVRVAPSAYSISGSTVTFSVAPVSGLLLADYPYVV